MRYGVVLGMAGGTALLLAAAAPAGAAFYASQVVSYDRGSGDGSYAVAAAALGMPDGMTGVGTDYAGVVSPFNPQWDTDKLVKIGGGGQLTLQFSHYVKTGDGLRIGVLSNAGFLDTQDAKQGIPPGTNCSPAQVFGADNLATVSVSPDNVVWYDLPGKKLFDIPTLYYVKGGPYEITPPSDQQVADFGKPFEGSLDSFNGQLWAGTVNAFNSSGGGTWLDLPGLPVAVTQIEYIRFSVAAGEVANIDAVVIADGAAGGVVPEPASGALALGGLVCFGLRRRRRGS